MQRCQKVAVVAVGEPIIHGISMPALPTAAAPYFLRWHI